MLLPVVFLLLFFFEQVLNTMQGFDDHLSNIDLNDVIYIDDSSEDTIEMTF